MNHKRTPLGAGPISPEEDELDQANAGRKVSRADTRVARRQERRDDVAKRKQQQRDRAPAPTQRLGETDRHYAKRVRQGAIDMVLPDLQEASAPTAPTQVEIQNKSPDMVTISGATTKEGVTRYRPEGDPFEYEYDANTGTFSAFDSEGTPVITGVKEGDAAYAEFAKHAKGGQTSYHGGSAQEEVSPGALITDADYAQAFEEMNASSEGVFQGPVDPRVAAPGDRTTHSALRLLTEHERETAELLAALPEGADPTEVRMRQGEKLQEKLRQLDGQEAAREESLPLPAEEAPPVEESPPASPTPKELRDNAANTAISREQQLVEFKRTATAEQDAQLKQAQDAYEKNTMGMGRTLAIAEVRAAMQDAADAEGTGYQVTDADAIYLLKNY